MDQKDPETGKGAHQKIPPREWSFAVGKKRDV